MRISVYLNKRMALFILVILLCNYKPAFADIYDIGADYKYKQLADVNWDSLQPGDAVQIHWRKDPYHEKIIIRCSGTEDNPIVIRGVKHPTYGLPVLDGKNARQFQKLDSIEGGRRALIIIGGKTSADNIIIQGLELRNANNTQKYRQGKKTISYGHNAAGVYVKKSKNTHIKDCIIHSCCIGVQTSYYPGVDRVTLSSNYIYNNGDFTRKRWGHNVYLCANKTLVQFNRFGKLYSDGNNIKDRSQHLVVRYNWIEGAWSYQLDLVEYEKYLNASAYVYGNVIVQGTVVANPKMIHFGGDDGGSRGGILYFFNNTVHAKSGRLEAFFSINKFDCRAILINNCFLGKPRIWIGNGYVTGSNNLFPPGSNINGFINTVFGGVEQILKNKKIPYFPKSNSLLVNRGKNLSQKIQYMPLPYYGKEKRPFDGRIDIGAYELPAVRKKR